MFDVTINRSFVYIENRTKRQARFPAEFLSGDGGGGVAAGSVPGPAVTDSRLSANAYIRRQECHREGQRPLSRAGLPGEHAATRSFLCNLCHPSGLSPDTCSQAPTIAGGIRPSLL